MIRLLIFEDNKNYREALTEVFEDSEKFFLTAIFENAHRAVPKVKKYQPDVILMDIEMPGISGLDALLEIKQASKNAKVLMLTQFEDNHRIFVALCRGASGYTLKSESLDKLETAIVDVFNGGGYFSSAIAGKIARFFFDKNIVQQNPDYISLTERELEVLEHLAQHKTYKETAAAMFLSYEGVHSHVKKIYEKLHVNSKSEAILKAIENRLIV